MGNSKIEEFLCTGPEESASDDIGLKEKEKEKEALPFDDPVCITLEYFRYETLQYKGARKKLHLLEKM